MMQTEGASPTTPTSAASSVFVDADDSLLMPDDGMAQELAQLEQLRRNVKKNLMLRPLSTQNLRAAATPPAPAATHPTTTSAPSHSRVESAVRSMPGSYPFSPNGLGQPPLSAASTASEYYSARPLSSASVSSYYFDESQFHNATSPATANFLPPGSFPKTPHTSQTTQSYGIQYKQPIARIRPPPAVPLEKSTPMPQPSQTPTAGAPTDPILVYDPSELLEMLIPLNYPTSSHLPRPLLLDIRPAGSYLASRIIYSLNLAIPSLILKRHRKALQKGGGGFLNLESLKAYVSTDAGRRNWVELMGGDDMPTGKGGTSVWNGEIVVFDEDMDESDPLAANKSPLSGSTPGSGTSSGSQITSTLSTPSSAAWMLLSLLRPLTSGPLYYLKGGITALRRLEGSDDVVVSGEWEIQDNEGSDGDADGEGSDAAASSDAQSSALAGSVQSDFEISPPANITPGNGTTPMTMSNSSKSLRLGTNTTPTKPTSISPPNLRGTSQGLFSIRTDMAAKHRPLPEIEPPTTSPKLEDRHPDSHYKTTSRPPPSPNRAMTLALDLSSPEQHRTPQAPGSLKSRSPPIPVTNEDSLPMLFDPYKRGERTHNRNRSGSSSAGSGSMSVRTPPSAVFLKNLGPGGAVIGGGGGIESRRPPPLLIPIKSKSPERQQRQETASAPPQETHQPSQQPQQTTQTPPQLQKPRLAKLDMTGTERLKTLAQIEGRTGANERAGPVGPPKLQLKTNPARAMTIATDNYETPPSRAGGAGGGGGPRLKLKLGNLNTSNITQPSNVLIVNTPSSPENSTSYVGVNANGGGNSHHYPPPSPGAGSGSSGFGLGGLGGNLPPRPRTPKTPLTPLLPPSPMTARPGGMNGPEPTSPAPVFTISTILPNFLYLGPELVKEEHATELEGLGVKRILNIAIECDDDSGLGLRTRFKYVRIPMRDTVEEVNVSKAMKEVCEILDDARLHSAPTYVHCKAGKSRSVTAVMAYLIHANHWTLSRAYAFVLDRRKGISPNIGFVSELMNFEEDELGGKSIGVVGAGGGAEQAGPSRRNHHHHRAHNSKNDGSSTARRRPAHLRESMPPVIQSYSAVATVGEHDTFSSGVTGGVGYPNSSNGSMAGGEMANGQLMSAGPTGMGKGHVSMRDMGEEMEVRDADGRYRHARRAPVDELTLQPVRRVSKAGLETWSAES